MNFFYSSITAAYIGLASLAGGVVLAEESKPTAIIEPQVTIEPSLTIKSPVTTQPQITIDCKTLLTDGASNNNIKKLESAIGCYTVAIQQNSTSLLAHAGRRTAALMSTFIAPGQDNNSLLERIYDSDTAGINAALFPQDGSFPEDNLDYEQLDDTLDYVAFALERNMTVDCDIFPENCQRDSSYRNHLLSSQFVPYLKSMEVKVPVGFDFSKTAAALYNCFEQDSEGTIEIKTSCPKEIRVTIPIDYPPETPPSQKGVFEELLDQTRAERLERARIESAEKSKPADGGSK